MTAIAIKDLRKSLEELKSFLKRSGIIKADKDYGICIGRTVYFDGVSDWVLHDNFEPVLFKGDDVKTFLRKNIDDLTVSLAMSFLIRGYDIIVNKRSKLYKHLQAYSPQEGEGRILFENPLKQRLRKILNIASILKRRKITFEIIGADLSSYVPGQHRDGGRYAFYKVIVCEPKRSYYVYRTSAEFAFCPYEGSFCNCGGGVREDEECYKMARKEHKIRLTISRLMSALEAYSDELCIRVKNYWWLDSETKDWLWELGFLEDEMCF